MRVCFCNAATLHSACTRHSSGGPPRRHRQIKSAISGSSPLRGQRYIAAARSAAAPAPSRSSTFLLCVSISACACSFSISACACSFDHLRIGRRLQRRRRLRLRIGEEAVDVLAARPAWSAPWPRCRGCRRDTRLVSPPASASFCRPIIAIRCAELLALAAGAEPDIDGHVVARLPVARIDRAPIGCAAARSAPVLPCLRITAMQQRRTGRGCRSRRRCARSASPWPARR